ncbi:MAG: hypothetical protein PHH49_03460 [Candidatus Omnitrophica bacterium]|nr:hypothetical protein [Candidatus Omnitrophota bacterium]MDD5488006.1 hypothetical protein [Candidatus Omnitrophota bacterium]
MNISREKISPLALIIAILLASALSVCAAICCVAGDEALFQVNAWQDVHAGERVSLQQNDIEDFSYFRFSRSGGEGVNAMEISLDGGDVWNDMERDGSDFFYDWYPEPSQTIVVSFREGPDEGDMRGVEGKATVVYGEVSS